MELQTKQTTLPRVQSEVVQSRESDDWLDAGDLSQIREMLELTPERRLKRIQGAVKGAIELRNAVRKENDAALDVIKILRVLDGHGVDFIVTEGFAAVLVGAPILSFVLGVVYLSTHENKLRLVNALGELNAFCENAAQGRGTPEISFLAETDELSLVTSYGRLDLHQSEGALLTYSDLVDRTDQYAIEGLRIRALDLGVQIEIREGASRAIDGYFLLFLRNIAALTGL